MHAEVRETLGEIKKKKKKDASLLGSSAYSDTQETWGTQRKA